MDQLLDDFAPLASSEIPRARRAWGRRRMTPESIAGSIEARTFAGLPEGVTKAHELLSALKKARAQLGIPGELLDLLDCLFSFTQPQDWQPGARPLVWPSNSLLAHQLGITLSGLKKRVRRAMQLRLMTDKPSPNGKRFGVRAGGAIRQDQSFGFDLSLLSLRHAEFVAAAERGQQLYQAARAMQRRGYAAKTALLQLIETATEQAVWTRYWEALEAQCVPLFPALATLDQPCQLAHAATTLESLRQEAEAVLTKALANQPESEKEGVESTPKGAAQGPQYNSTNQLSDLKNTGISLQGGSSAVGSGGAPPPAVSGEEVRYSPGVVLEAAPEIGGYCRSSHPTWDDLAESARLTCPQLDISQRLWARACQLLGRHGAALALAVMVHQMGRQPVRSPGGYFHAMIERAARGELDLNRSYFGMRSRLPTGIQPLGGKGMHLPSQSA